MLAQSAEISSQDDLAWPQLRRKINKLASHTQRRRGSSDCLLTPMILRSKWRACVGAGKKPTTEKRQMFVEPKSCRSRTQWKEQHNTSLFARKKGEKRLGEEEAGQTEQIIHVRITGRKGRRSQGSVYPTDEKKTWNFTLEGENRWMLKLLPCHSQTFGGDKSSTSTSKAAPRVCGNLLGHKWVVETN